VKMESNLSQTLTMTLLLFLARFCLRLPPMVPESTYCERVTDLTRFPKTEQLKS